LAPIVISPDNSGAPNAARPVKPVYLSIINCRGCTGQSI